jgi:hypothetical protein
LNVDVLASPQPSPAAHVTKGGAQVLSMAAPRAQ